MTAHEPNIALRNEYDEGRWDQAMDLLRRIRQAGVEGIMDSQPSLLAIIEQAKAGIVVSDSLWGIEIRVLKLAKLWPTGK